MKRLFPALIAVGVLFSSCSFDFGGDGKDTSVSPDPDNWDYVFTRYQSADKTTDVEVMKAYCNDEYRYTEENYINENGLIDQVQKYGAGGDLQSIVNYTFVADSDYSSGFRLATEALWYEINAEYKPSSLKVYEKTSGLTEQTTVAYYYVTGDADSFEVSPQSWSQRYGSIEVSQVDATATEAAMWSRNADADPLELSALLIRSKLPDSTNWNVTAKYGDNAGNLSSAPNLIPQCPGGETPIDPVSGSYHDRIGSADIPAVTDPAESVPSLPDPLNPGIDAVSYAFWLADSEGDSTVVLDKDWLPVSMTRANEDRLPGKLTVSVNRDDMSRILGKSVSMDGTELFDLAITRDSVGFPTDMVLDGDAFVIPLNFHFVYDADTHILREIQYDAPDGTGLVSVKFEYVNASVAEDVPELATDSLLGLDPFGFMEGLLDPNIGISLFTGEGDAEKLWMSMRTESLTGDDSGYKITVIDPGDDLASTDDDSDNGYWKILYADGGAKASISSYNAAETELWREEYDYGDAITEAVTGILPMDFISSTIDDTLALGETVMDLAEENPTVSNFASAWVTNFIYDILF